MVQRTSGQCLTSLNPISFSTWEHSNRTLRTLRVLASILQTWMKLSADDWNAIFCCDATRAFLQAFESKRLIIYSQPLEFFETYPQLSNHA